MATVQAHTEQQRSTGKVAQLVHAEHVQRDRWAEIPFTLGAGDLAGRTQRGAEMHGNTFGKRDLVDAHQERACWGVGHGCCPSILSPSSSPTSRPPVMSVMRSVSV